MKVRRPLLVVLLLLPALNQPAARADDVAYQKDILPFLTKHCFTCHGNGKAKADLSFDRYKDNPSVLNDRKVWDNVQHMLRTREMPPMSRPQPTPAEIDAELKAIRALFDAADRIAKPNVGRVTIRRLNRTEYNNTIRDLVGVDFKPAEDFPADDVGYGFDNIGDVLSISPLLLEKYLSAAEAILDQAIVTDPPKPPRPTTQRFNDIRSTAILSAREVAQTINFEAGEYRIRCRVAGDQVGDEPVRAMLRVADKDVKEFKIKATPDKPEEIEATVQVKAGATRVALAFLNPYNLPGTDKDRGLYFRAVEVEGPFGAPAPPLPAVHRRLMAYKEGLAPRDAAREIVGRFATRAFRRPVKPEEVEKCLALYDALQKKGQRFEVCVRAALYRVLVSPHFLFRVELDPPNTKPGTAYPIGEYELASRLSYFLWNSMPDDELFALAAKGQLRQNLEPQVHRMVKDPKSTSFLHGFAEQWLTLRKLELASPDPKKFPDFNDNLRRAMMRESVLFFEAVVREDRSVLDLLDADFTFVNDQLAKHYGIAGVRGKEFVRVKAPPNRGGILTQASILTLTSNATRTSPVKRGKFVLDQILNTPPPPPPDNVPDLEDQKQLKGTLRQIMEQHRANAVCASCHQRMDPIGFAFENYDAVGAWRDKDGGVAIDASGVLPGGRSFNGPEGLKRFLKEKKDLFADCVAEKMLTYALGRGVEHYDRRAVSKVTEALGKNDYRFSTLLIEIVKSDPFQQRMAAEGPR
jgi:mono/diheme cytochrome c family protein